MALLSDQEPPLREGEQKTNILFQKTAKIKNYILKIYQKLAPAFFLLGSLSRKKALDLSDKKEQVKRNLLPVYIFSKEYLPHLVVGTITFVVVVSNFVVRFAKADINEYVVSDPGLEINLAQQANQYTPLLKNSAQAVEKAYAASTDEFAQTSTTVDTVYTEREEPLPDNSASTVYYTVRNGDALTTLGWKFKVKVATIKYVNDLDGDLIKPGQQLKIPQAGYEVPASKIAERAKQKLAAANRNTTYRNSSSRSAYSVVNHASGSKNNGFPYGYCTWYVASKRSVNWSGNAKAWLSNASRAGASTGSSPAVGAIVVTNESWWGHVAYVESVSEDGSSITISEMNYVGYGVRNTRTLQSKGGVVRGYIY